MSHLPTLEKHVTDAADRRAAHPRRRLWPSAAQGDGRRQLGRGALLVILVAGVGGTGALAAGGVIHIGSPQSSSSRPLREPTSGLGVIRNGSVQVLAIRTPDPDGGPDWGLRVSSTTRGLGCLQAGRVVGDRFGVYGTAKAFHDDGKLHPRSRTDVVVAGGCAPLDAAGRLFQSVTIGGLPASAKPGSCNGPRTIIKRGPPKSLDCTPGTLRDIHMGLLGPEAQSVTYTQSDGSTKTVPTVGPKGAFLIVRTTGVRNLNGTVGGLLPKASPITQLRFKDGSTCDITPAGGTGAACRLPGRREAIATQTQSSDVRAMVRARLIAVGGGHYNLTITFRSRVAISDASSRYQFRLNRPGRRRTGALGFSDRNYTIGDTVTHRFISLGGRGTYTGTVDYVAVGTTRSARVGTFTVTTT